MSELPPGFEIDSTPPKARRASDLPTVDTRESELPPDLIPDSMLPAAESTPPVSIDAMDLKRSDPPVDLTDPEPAPVPSDPPASPSLPPLDLSLSDPPAAPSPAVSEPPAVESLPPLDLSLSDAPLAPSPAASEPAAVESLPPLDLSLPAPPDEDTGQPTAADPLPLAIDQVPGLSDLPEEEQAAIARRARRVVLEPGEEVTRFGLILVESGLVEVLSVFSDCVCARVDAGQVVVGRGTLSEAMGLRVMAGARSAAVAVWDTETLAEVTRACPWVEDEIRAAGDRLQALAGVVQGWLGDELDDVQRLLVFGRSEISTLLSGETVIEKGSAVSMLRVVGAGSVEIVDDEGQVTEDLGIGDAVYPSLVLAGRSAPHAVRSGLDGALLLRLPRAEIMNLAPQVPQLIELLAR